MRHQTYGTTDQIIPENNGWLTHPWQKKLTHGTVVAEPLFHWFVDPSSCLPAKSQKVITDQKVVGLPGEEEKDQEGRGEAAFHAGMGARGMEKAAGQDWVFCCGTQWHSVALSGRQDQTERARLRYGGHTPPPPVDSTAGRGGGGAYTAKPLRLESVLIMGRKMY